MILPFPFIINGHGAKRRRENKLPTRAGKHGKIIPAKQNRHAVEVCVNAYVRPIQPIYSLVKRTHNEVASAKRQRLHRFREIQIPCNDNPHFSHLRFIDLHVCACATFPIYCMQHIRDPQKTSVFRNRNRFSLKGVKKLLHSFFYVSFSYKSYP